MKAIPVILAAVACGVLAGCGRAAAGKSEDTAAVAADKIADVAEIEITVNRSSNGVANPALPEHRTVHVVAKKNLTRDQILAVAKWAYETSCQNVEESNSLSESKSVNVFFWDRDSYYADPRDGLGWRLRVNSHEKISGPEIAEWPAFAEWND